MSGSTSKIILSSSSDTAARFLIQLLTELGLDTNSPPSGAAEKLAAAAPYIVHDPALGDTLPGILAAGQVTLDYALVVTGRGEEPLPRAGEAQRFHRLVETLTAHDIPHVLLHFPRIMQDRGYCFQKLRPLLGAMPQAEFDRHFARVSQPCLHPSTDASTVAKQLDGDEAGRVRRARRLQRHAIQAAAACVLISVGWFAASSQRAVSEPAWSAPLLRQDSPAAAHFKSPARSPFDGPFLEHAERFPSRPGRHGFRFPFDHPAPDRPVQVSTHQI